MILALWTSAWAGCDVAALTELAASLDPASRTSAVAPGIAAACPRPVGWVRALKAPDDPYADQQAALAQPSAWTEACAGGLSALPSGYEIPTPGDRLTLWDRCGLGALGLFDVTAWIGASGPPVTTIVASQVLAQDGVPLHVRQRLVRALAGMPPDPPTELPAGVESLRVTGPVSGSGAPSALGEAGGPTQISLGPVPWPRGTPADTVCTVQLTLVHSGSPGRVDWVGCPESARDAVTQALDNSWFEPRRVGGQIVQTVVQVSFTPRR